MSLWLSSTSLMRPSMPVWLEDLCQRLSDNDSTLTTVELSHQRIDDNAARTFAKALGENHTCQVLILSLYNIVDDGAFYLGSVVGKNRSILRKLQVRDIRNAREFVAFFEGLLTNVTIEELSMRHCVVWPQSAKILKDVVEQSSILQELRLVDTQLVGTQSLQSICEGLARNKSIQRLSLVNNGLDHYGAQYLSTMLKTNRTLEELCICENQLDDAGIVSLCKGLKENPTVHKLDLRSNCIGLTGALGLQEIVKTSKALTTLCLVNNELGTFGTEALVEGLRSDSVLQKLDLSENEVDSVGAKSIASMLRTNDSIQELNLAFNSIGDAGAAAVASVLVHNTTVTSLSLKRNNISKHGAVAFAIELPKMRGLKELIMTKNSIDPEGACSLLMALKHNMDLEYLHVEEKVSEPILKEIVHWIRLNKAGRRIFRGHNIPLPLWPHVLARISSDVDAVFHFLTEKPDILQPKEHQTMAGLAPR